MRDTPAMLRELNVVEQRYQAVLEVLDGTPVTEVAQRFGVARQTVHRWVARYRESGLDKKVDRCIGVLLPASDRLGCQLAWPLRDTAARPRGLVWLLLWGAGQQKGLTGGRRSWG